MGSSQKLKVGTDYSWRSEKSLVYFCQLAIELAIFCVKRELFLRIFSSISKCRYSILEYSYNEILGSRSIFNTLYRFLDPTRSSCKKMQLHEPLAGIEHAALQFRCCTLTNWATVYNVYMVNIIPFEISVAHLTICSNCNSLLPSEQ